MCLQSAKMWFSSAPPPSLPITQEQWIRQIMSAESWLEKLGFVHGHLRPANLLLDVRENIQPCDFDTTVMIGEQLNTKTS
ncbi:hypothetical protein F5B22DRAFT_627157 [Xylaria bambusicola]|uniref:uncharacterized protein n=1 Tax=Xylaria bambusicola TaxID=326684 RepID=UPI002008BE99|nr:uncharacterized protein F5B22DRAFT_627157 [Xylaria bambusicola]KAI0505630.1 hypothetical protein F5B22DRAFT_627157 [Xylaria bambusicola]